MGTRITRLRSPLPARRWIRPRRRSRSGVYFGAARCGGQIKSSTCALVTHAQAAGAGSIWASPENEPGAVYPFAAPGGPRVFPPCLGARMRMAATGLAQDAQVGPARSSMAETAEGRREPCVGPNCAHTLTSA
jgi:hypothetical protein